MRNLALACCALALLAFATSAFAQADNQGTNADPCMGTMDIDTCMWSDSQPASGGNYLSCTALGSQNQSCQSLLKDQIFGNLFCGPVSYSAKCYCDDKTHATSGYCTYQPR